MLFTSIKGTDLHYRFDGDDAAAGTVLFSNSLSTDLSGWEQRFAASSLVPIVQARHFANVEKAEEFDRAPLDFLGSLARAA